MTDVNSQDRDRARDGDQAQAAREGDARRLLLEKGAASLPRPPWLYGKQPPAAADLIRFALWQATAAGPTPNAAGPTPNAAGPTPNAAGPTPNAGDLGEEGVLAALTLLAAARAELDQSEAALLFTARSHGLSWPRISRAMGLRSPQAAQQRFDRVSGRAQSLASQ